MFIEDPPLTEVQDDSAPIFDQPLLEEVELANPDNDEDPFNYAPRDPSVPVYKIIVNQSGD